MLRGQTIAHRIELIGGFDHTARWSVTFKLPLRDARGRIVGTAGNGLSPRQYIKRVRVRTACRALVYTDQSVASIAAEHGFPDQSYFTREFREVIGRTPRDYRKAFRQPR